LVAVTPACGFIGATASIALGILAGAISFVACTKIKTYFGYDDALDVFGVHGVAGSLGMIFTGFFAETAVNSNLNLNLKTLVGHSLWLEQLKGMGLTAVLAVGATAVIGFSIKALFGFRPLPEAEMEGLDQNQHGEHGYIYDSSSI
jgi:Amt family ammonium transporter